MSPTNSDGPDGDRDRDRERDAAKTYDDAAAGGPDPDGRAPTDVDPPEEPDPSGAPAPPLEPSSESSPGSSSDAPPPEPRTVVKRRGGFLAFLALLLSLAAFAGVAWPWWLAYQGDERLAQIFETPRIGELDAGLGALDARIGELRGELRAELAEARRETEAARARTRELEQTLTEVRRAFADLSSEVAADSPVDDVQWRLAEAAYLLRVANLRARMEGDREGAEALLRAADDLLAELDDYGLFPVREAIATALASLRGAPAVDRVGLYLEIESLGERIEGLPVDVREYAGRDTAAPAAPPAADEDAAPERIAGLVARFTSLVDFRRGRAEPVRPLLAPTESAFLRHNLALKLEQAQLALLEGDQAVWEDTLTKSRRWIATWFEADDADVVALGEALDRLVLEQVAVKPPDISAPLNELRRLRGRGLAPDDGGAGS